MSIRVLPIVAALSAVFLSGCANNHEAAARVSLALEQSHIATTQSVRYRENSAEIDSASNPVLDTVAQYMRSNPAAHLEIFDTSNSTNLDGLGFDAPLSRERAEAAKAYIVSSGVDPSRVGSQGLEQVVVTPH